MKISYRRFTLSMAGVLLFAAASMSRAEPTSGAAAGPDRLAPDINVSNWYWGPGNHWSYQHTSRIFPSATIDRGNGPVAALGYALRDLNGISFINPITQLRMSMAEMYASTDTDAFLVMKNGKIVTELYFNGMRAADRHLLMSVSKSVLGMLSGILVAQGRLDPNAQVTSYVPELKGSAYDGATVRNLLDMTVGMEFDEDYSSKTSDLYRLDEAAGWVARGPNAMKGLHEYLATLKRRHGAHGGEFRYISANTDAMGWVVERATHTDYAQLVSDELWSKLGAERDAYVLLDGFQAAYADPGLNMTLRDLGRFSQMVLDHGFYNGQQIVPGPWIEDTRHAGDSKAWKSGPEYSYFRKLSGYEDGSYRNYWYVADPRRGHITAIGLAGQLIVIDPSSNTIVVKFSSHATPADDQYQIEYAGAIAIVDALSARAVK
jgi:CubicO group peptidase (beta-lactamase class C family)